MLNLECLFTCNTTLPEHNKWCHPRAAAPPAPPARAFGGVGSNPAWSAFLALFSGQRPAGGYRAQHADLIHT